ncbi:Fic/DOC family protein [Jatrophihabitans endophyticus]|uniref:Fic/DOC family protein n=1 Tax=Jatrophihabitans endophyticus TaxID=1206085 RepID=A0A1M5HLT5_9ACTN|nr:Fic family protein [Jatrophihabitans endophyticus]SHG16919.1 Fic/DOC family protein [Jatrophihabitans endophyticus]
MPPKPRRNRPPRRATSRPWPWADTPVNEARIADQLVGVREQAAKLGRGGQLVTEEDLRRWHKKAVAGVRLIDPFVAGHFRGEGPPAGRLAACPVHVNNVPGTPPGQVPSQVRSFFAELARRVSGLGTRRHSAPPMPEELFDDVVALLAWVHGEWVRIHPFVNINGSTARLLVVTVGAYFGIPVPLPGKPRPGAVPMGAAGLTLSYDLAAAQQMVGNDHVMELYLRRLLT